MSRHLLYKVALLLLPLTATAHPLTERYTKEHPVVIVGDWDKPPYEFLNDKGQPAGTNVDVMRAILEKQMRVPVRFVLKEWGNALKTFERGDADLILANVRRYGNAPYVATRNIINYNRVRVATIGDSAGIVSMKQLVDEGVVLKPNDYSAFFFSGLDSAHISHVEFQSPKVALTGLVSGDNKYFVWGEEPLKWKLKELNLEGIKLCEVSIPVSEVHVVGRDSALIYEIDDIYSRLKQSGEVERINHRWLHPEDSPVENATPMTFVLIAGTILLAAVFFLQTRLARSRVRNATRTSTDLNNMMMKALHMGNFHITEYDIRRDRMTNRYGHLLPDEGLTMKEFVSRIHPDEQAEFQQKMGQMLGGRTRKFELDKRWNAGTDDAPNWLTFNGHVIVELDDEGRPAYIINAIHDVTNNMEEDHAARELISKYERLMQQSPVAMSFYDKDGWLIDLNDAMRELCGFDNADADAERFWRTLCMFDVPLFRNVYSPEDREDLFVCQHMEYPEIGLDRFIEFHIRPLLDKQGQLVNYFITTLDMTEECLRDRRMHEQAREISKADQLISQYEWNLRYLLENSKAYIWRTDFRERKTYYSRSLREYAYVQTCDEYMESIHPDQKEEIANLLSKPDTLDEVYTYMVHFSYTPFTKREQWEFVAGKINYDENGEVYEHVGIARDVTDLVNARRQLKEETERADNAGRQKSAFLASMTHELRTPLNSIVGFSDLLGTVETSEERREFIRIIRNNCDMLLRLINDILEASSIDDGPQSITLAPVDFAQAFDDICQSVAERVQNPDVVFIKDNPYTSCQTHLDIGRIQQVITNFVTNAIKYTDKGHIRVGYRNEKRTVNNKEKEGLYIYCEDTGAGIPKDKQATIFERFVKLNEFVQGTGLGLSICESIAERYGGTIGVDSQGEGHGSTFWIWVPCEIQQVTNV